MLDCERRIANDADPGFLKRGSILGLQAKKGGSNFGPNVKKPISWPKKGGPDPWTPPPRSAHVPRLVWCRDMRKIVIVILYRTIL